MISDAAAFFSPSGTSNNHMLRSGTKHLSPKPCAQDTGSCRLQRALPMLPACVATSIICHHTLKACQTPVLGYQHLNSRCAPDRLAAKSCHHIMTSQTDGLARSCIDGKAKPPGSLGQLEHWAVRLATLQGSLKPKVDGARLLLFAADHGITEAVPAVSAYPRTVTPAMFGAIARGQAASTVLAAANACGVVLTDVGVDADVSSIGAGQQVSTTVLHKKVCAGSQPFNSGPAMTSEQCQQALAAGAEAVAVACQEMAAAAALQGVRDWQDSHGVVCIGELGIGNTTAAAAMVAALCPDLSPADVCGRGTGVGDEGLLVKQSVVQEALTVNCDLIQQGPLQGLQAVGGLEVAAMTGAYLEAAKRGMPAVVDGYISGAAALAALRHNPDAVGRVLFLSHQSTEAGHCGGERLMQALGCGAPVLHLGFRLGEGTGAVLAVPLLRSAAAIMRDMASLDDVMAQ